ncbi:MAG: EamA family transporter RarD [Deltaproteobacteria bacterium]|nr:EamA family transporter RarD [Deltaproteobacteria bacterium]
MEASLESQRSVRRGVQFGLAAYLIWGFFPAYFKAVAGVPPLEVLSHRIFWSALFLLLLALGMGRSRDLRSAFRDRRVIATLSSSTLLLSLNWLVFIFAVESGRVLDSSLGYFMNPLVSVLLGWSFLGERLRRAQNVSLVLAVAGVAYLTLSYGRLPWVSLVLAVSFAIYGLLRKTARVDALVGLTVETCLLAPFALGYLVFRGVTGEGHFLAGAPSHDVLLPLAGLVTAAPLLLFIGATRRLRLATIGFLQYITPSLHLLLAVWAYGEPFTRSHLVTFACIWTALALYSLESALDSGFLRLRRE